ncbi:MAG: class I SAM-dependent methyltransferase [Acidimicrobiales bacterium]
MRKAMGKGRSTDRMRSYWDERARENAFWYVDTSLDPERPDLGQFFATGRTVVSEVLDRAPFETTLPGRGLAVEIGSGLGRVCRALAERFELVIGVDVAPEMVSRARELVPEDNVRFEVGDGASLGALADGSADVVVSFTVFQHIPDATVVDAYIREAARVLRPGGLLAFQWNNQPGRWRWTLRRSVLAALQSSGLKPERFGRHAPEFLGSRIPLRRIQRVLRETGLDLRATRGTGSLFAWAWAQRR